MGVHLDSAMRGHRMLGIALAFAALAVTDTARAESDWVLEKPKPETQYQKSIEERGGINPCLTEDPGFAGYHPWVRMGRGTQMLVPHEIPAHGRVDVMIHFHGQEAARKEWVRVMRAPVFVGVDLGTGSRPYHSQFLDPDAFERLLRTTQAKLSDTEGRPIEIRRVGLSAWSAGYGAVQEILTQPLGKRAVDTVVLLDGLHSGYSGKRLNQVQLAPFAEFASRAAGGKKLMFVSHSSIVPPGYASTTETAHYLIDKLGGKPHPSRSRPSDPMGLDLISFYVQKGFHVRGFAGNGKLDHCAHFGLYRDVLQYHVRRRWK